MDKDVLDGIGAISDHINSSRFTLRFLLSIHTICDLLKDLKQPSKEKYSDLRRIQKMFTIVYSMLEFPCYVKMVAPYLLKNINTSALARTSCQCLTIGVLIDLSILAKDCTVRVEYYVVILSL